MPRLANYTVQCKGCDNLVEPNGAAKRRRNGLIGLFLLGVAGLLGGTSIGIATAGAGIAATIPLGLIGTYTGWKVGTGWARFRDGVNCPECGHVFGGYGEMSLPGGGELSLPSLRSETAASDSESNSERGGESAFRIGFSCANCGSEWVHGFATGKEIVDAADVDHGDGVVVMDGNDSKRLACPTCESTRAVDVAERSPSSEEFNTNVGDEESRSLAIRLLDFSVYVGSSLVVALGIALTLAVQDLALVGLIAFVGVMSCAAVARPVFGLRIID